MNKQPSPFTAGLVVAVIAVGGLFLMSNSIHSRKVGISYTGDKNAPLTTLQPPNTCNYCSHNLVGKSADEVAQFARDFAQQQLKAKSPPQVLLTRLVDDQALADLGLGCGVAFAVVEKPPTTLTILKGQFDFRSAAPGFGQMPPPVPGKSSYIVYVFDAWAATPVMIMPSLDGALVKKALQDPSLPDDPEIQMPTTCATPLPKPREILHYGQEAPGFPVPPHQDFPVTPHPEDTPFFPGTAVPVGTVIPVTFTPGGPTPVPTELGPLPTGSPAP